MPPGEPHALAEVRKLTTLHNNNADFIKGEFECFVRIGQDAAVRCRVQRAIERLLITGGREAAALNITMELRDPDGALREMWVIETDSQQMVRLSEFLRRFSVEDVRMMDSMLNG